MEKVVVNAKERKSFSKAETKKLRAEGQVPGVIYSKEHDTIAFQLPEKDISPYVFSAETHLISLKIDDKEEQECIIKDVQFDPITDRITHFDLLGLKRGEKFQLEIPVQLVGTPVGIKEGGVIQHLLHKLEVECLPKDIPQHIDVNVEHLSIGDAVKVEEIEVENVEILNASDTVVVTVTHPKLVVAEEPEEEEELLEGEEEPEEPEVIGKGKSEDEEESEEGEEK